jgi:hypothetical protein
MTRVIGIAEERSKPHGPYLNTIPAARRTETPKRGRPPAAWAEPLAALCSPGSMR